MTPSRANLNGAHPKPTKVGAPQETRSGVSAAGTGCRDAATLGLLLLLLTVPLRVNADTGVYTNDFGPYFVNAQSWNGQFTVYTNDFGPYTLEAQSWNGLFTAYTNDFGPYSLAAESWSGLSVAYTNDFGPCTLAVQGWIGLLTAYTNDFGPFSLAAQSWIGLSQAYTNDFGPYALVAQSWNNLFIAYTNDYGPYVVDPLSWSLLFAAYTNDFGPYILVAEPPLITAQPADLTVLFGSDALFTVSASSTAPLYYQWAKNAALIGMATNSQLPIVQCRLNDSGPYQVVLSNAYGMTTSAVATLSVRFAAANPLMAQGGAGQASFVVQAEPGRAYWLESRTNLIEGDWMFVCGITNTSGAQQLLDASATNRCEFYRIGSIPVP